MVVGVTGASCAGKGVAVEHLRSLGYTAIDVDGVGHAALAREAPAVAARFGSSVLAAAGGIDRRALGRIVFADDAALRDLEAIVHPWMVAEVERQAAAAPGPVTIDAAILFRMGLQRLCDLVVCVRAPLPLRLLRAMRRDRRGLAAALRRLLAQGPVCPKTPQPDVDILVVGNRWSRQAFVRRLERSLRAKGAV
jgi:dephospho-CoA kinase